MPRGMTVVNRIGLRYGRLVVVSRAENRVEPSGAIRARWNCICDCGNEHVASGQALSRGRVRSCGCLNRENESKHGMSAKPIYRVWSQMKQRCTNPNSTHWACYGGRGIKLCEAWHDFEAFYRDVGNLPTGMTLERIDNEKGYEPGNVRWATRLEQANNRRTNVLLEYDGRVQTIAEWAREVGKNKSIIIGRLGRGWSIKRALNESIKDTGRRRRKRKT